MTELRLLSKDCRFFRHGRVVRYRIVFGPNSRKVRERLINEGATLKLSKTIDIARTVETSKATLEMESTKQIGRVQNSNKPETRKCSDFGGKLHGKSTSFPAHGQKFQKANHFAKVCRSRNCKLINPRLITDPFLYWNCYQHVRQQSRSSIRTDWNQHMKHSYQNEVGHGSIGECVSLEKCPGTSYSDTGKQPLKVEGKVKLTCTYKGLPHVWNST